MDESLYSALAQATQYYQVKEELFDRIQQEENALWQIETDFNEDFERKKKPYESVESIGSLLWIPSACILAIAFIVVFIKIANSINQTVSQLSDTLPFLLCLALLTVGGAVMVAFSRAKQRKIGRKYDNIYEKQIKPQIEYHQESLSNLHDMIVEFESENKHLIDVLPFSYRNIEASSFLFLAIANGRADTLKEAINLYEEWIHRQMLENAARQTAEAQEYMALALDELNNRQAETNNHLKAIEFMQYWQYINQNK